MLIAIHRRLFRWYHERRVRKTQREIAFWEREIEAPNNTSSEIIALTHLLDYLTSQLRYHQNKLAALFPQPTNER